MLRFLPLLLAALLPVQAAVLSKGDWDTDLSKRSIDLSELKAAGPPKDGIPSIDDPKFVNPQETSSWLDAKEPVILVEHAGEVRGYPLQILVWHELVNDRIGDLPILVSYCPLCNSAITFDRRVEGKVYEFGVSGLLRHSDLVMYDRQTDSLWQQLTAEAIVGEMTGKELKIVTSQVIDFGKFAKNFPNGKILSKQTGYSRAYGKTPYAGYEFGRRSRGLFPVPSNPNLAVSPTERLVTISRKGKTKAYTLDKLEDAKVEDGKIKGMRYVIFYEPTAVSVMDNQQISSSKQVGSVGVFSPEVNGKRLKFEYQNGKIIDKKTNSTWNILGMATDGRLEGERLEPIEHGVFYAFAWLTFEPDTEVHGAQFRPRRSRGIGQPGRDTGIPGAGTAGPGAGTPGGAGSPFPPR